VKTGARWPAGCQEFNAIGLLPICMKHKKLSGVRSPTGSSEESFARSSVFLPGFQR